MATKGKRRAASRGRESARFLDTLADLAAADFIIGDHYTFGGHLRGMSGTDGAYFALAVMEFLGKRGDPAVMRAFMRVVREAV